MNRKGSLTLVIGLAVLIVVGLACGAEEKKDSTNAGPASDAHQAQGQPGPSGSPGENTSTLIREGAPLANLTYEGAVYNQGSLSTVNGDDLEYVGSTTESNTLPPGKSMDIYRLMGREEGHVYTLEPEHEQSVQDEGEDGHTVTITTSTIEAHWVRWTAADSRANRCTDTGRASC